MHEAFETIACNLCGSTDARLLYPSTLPQDLSMEVTKRFAPADHASGNDQIVKCSQCGLMFTSPRMKREFIWQGYSEAVDAHYAAQAEERIATFNRTLDTIERYVPSRGKLLDIGCAAGFFLKVAKDRGWTVHGLEPNRGLAEWGRRQYNVTIQTQDFLEAELPLATFDVVTFWDVLEHVPDPRAYIRKTSQILKPGGFLFINYPDTGSLPARIFRQRWWFISPVHIFYFNQNTLKRMLESENLSLVKHTRHWQTLGLGYLVKRFEAYSRALSKIGFTALRAFHLQRVPIRYYAGQALAVAQKQKA